MKMPAKLSSGKARQIIIFLCLLPLNACVPIGMSPDSTVFPSVSQRPHRVSAQPCVNRFIPHALDHVTSIEGEVVRTYDSNGAGLAVNDLDRDGDLDLVLANLAGPNAIFWNEGAFNFRKQTFPHGQTRGVSIVDIDGDGWLDIVFAHRETRPLVWMNDGEHAHTGRANETARQSDFKQIPGFTRLDWFAANQKAYTFAWADLDGDIDLDMVLATYQSEYTRVDPTDLANGGVVYYENTGEDFAASHLSPKSQALALLLIDLNQDGRLDIWVGHDFLMPDQVWLRTEQGWQEAAPFGETAQNTMSFAAGDVDNDGREEIFAADMKPFEESEDMMVAWSPLMETMVDMQDDSQIIENVLQVPGRVGEYANEAGARGLQASGWSWSAQFGDLDQDGFVDLYVVNGMAAEEMFGHLPGDELVEENLAFRNDGQGRFFREADWGLNATEGGRSMVMADLDADGDLDIAVNNLLAPAVVFENRLCGGNSLTVDLAWPHTKNTHAIGAQLTLHTTSGRQVRTIRSNGGYLTGEPSQVHFGFPAGALPLLLEIRWPDGAGSAIAMPHPGVRLTIERRK